MKDTRYHLITWGFDRSGTIYMDSYLEIKDRQKDVQTAKSMEMRMRFQMTNMSLIRTDQDITREDIENYVESGKHDPSVIKKLREGQVRLTDITRVASEHNSINFILDED